MKVSFDSCGVVLGSGSISLSLFDVATAFSSRLDLIYVWLGNGEELLPLSQRAEALYTFPLLRLEA